MSLSIPKELLIKIKGDSAELSRAGSQSQAILRRIGSEAKSVGVAIGASVATMAGIGFGIKKAFLDPFSESQDALAALSASLAATGKAGAADLKAITDEAGRLQSITRAEGDALAAATAKLAQLAPSLNTPELVKAERAIVALSERMGGDLDSAAAALGKTLGTSTNALKRQGIEVDMNASAGERLNQILTGTSASFDVAVAKGQTWAGTLERLKNVSGDLRETIGEVIVRTFNLTGGANDLVGKLQGLNDKIQANQAKWVAWGQVGIASVKFVAESLQGLVVIAFNVGQLIGRAFDIAANLMVGSMLKAAEEIKKHWFDLSNFLQDVMDPFGLIPNITDDSKVFPSAGFFEAAIQQTHAFVGDLGDIKSAVLDIGKAWLGVQSAAENARLASGSSPMLIPPTSPGGAPPGGGAGGGGGSAATGSSGAYGVGAPTGKKWSPLFEPRDYTARLSYRPVPLPEIPSLAPAMRDMKQIGGAMTDAAGKFQGAGQIVAQGFVDMANAAVSGTQSITQSFVGMLQEIIRHQAAQSAGGLFGGIGGILLGGALGIAGSLFAKHDRHDPVMVQIADVDDVAARKLGGNAQRFEKTIHVTHVTGGQADSWTEAKSRRVQAELLRRTSRDGIGRIIAGNYKSSI